MVAQWAVCCCSGRSRYLPRSSARRRLGAWASASRAWWGRLSHWWLTWGLGALWWPGLLITLTLAAAAFSHGREAKPWVAPRATDREQVSRPGVVMALGAWVLGASVVIALPWLAA